MRAPAVAVDLQTSLADIEFAGFLTLKRPEENDYQGVRL
jgi:hypothetical protein